MTGPKRILFYLKSRFPSESSFSVLQRHEQIEEFLESLLKDNKLTPGNGLVYLKTTMHILKKLPQFVATPVFRSKTETTLRSLQPLLEKLNTLAAENQQKIKQEQAKDGLKIDKIITYLSDPATKVKLEHNMNVVNNSNDLEGREIQNAFHKLQKYLGSTIILKAHRAGVAGNLTVKEFEKA